MILRNKSFVSIFYPIQLRFSFQFPHTIYMLVVWRLKLTLYFIVSWWDSVSTALILFSLHPGFCSTFSFQLPTKLFIFFANKHDLISKIDILEIPKSNKKVWCSWCCNLLVTKMKNLFLFTIQGFQFKKCLLWF